MQPFTTVTSRVLVIVTPDLDTDEILPIRFLTHTSRSGLGSALFANSRYDADGRPLPSFPLNIPALIADHHRQFLVVGPNFGCGPPREQAVWALLDFGFRAIISSKFPASFYNDALKNGLLPVEIPAVPLGWLHAHPNVPVTIDLSDRSLTLPDGESVSFDIEPFARYCLSNGMDQLDFLYFHLEEIEKYENSAWYKELT